MKKKHVKLSLMFALYLVVTIMLSACEKGNGSNDDQKDNENAKESVNQENENDFEADTDETDENAGIQKIEKDGYTIYVHGVIPERNGEISAEDAVEIAIKSFSENDLWVSDQDAVVEYHLVYLNVISSEYSSWGVRKHVDGEPKCECIVSVLSGDATSFEVHNEALQKDKKMS